MSDPTASEAEIHETFAAAQHAAAEQDWAALFALVDAADLRAIAANSVKALLSARPEPLRALCDEHGYGGERVDELAAACDRMVASAMKLTKAGAAGDPGAHRQLVKDFEATIKDGLARVADLAAFTAALEREMRTLLGGGSISSRLLDGATLEAVTVEASKARGRASDGRELRFVRRRGRWLLRLR
ncbi:MAG: hypothetical protein KC503_07385 [Myxococcales bacterium]|nr:hypothetical protein [Myxococcales bacterium]